MLLVRGPDGYRAIRSEAGLSIFSEHEKRIAKLKVGESIIVDVDGIALTYRRIPDTISTNCLAIGDLDRQFNQIVEYLFGPH